MSIEGGVEVSLDGGVLHCGGVDTVVYTLSGASVYSGNGDVYSLPAHKSWWLPATPPKWW